MPREELKTRVVYEVSGHDKLISCFISVQLENKVGSYGDPADAAFLENVTTRQLPTGASHYQWGGFSDRYVCNIHGDKHLRQKIRPVGPSASAGERRKDERTGS